MFERASPLLRLLPLGVAALVSAHQSVTFIRASSVVVDGQRYYALFDDGMISMRYASNLVHGHGLVWNPGERVEGFTNPLWVLVMAVAVLVASPAKAVLAIQILGASLLAGSAWIFARLGGRFFPGSPWPVVALFEGGFYLLLTTAFPLRFWTHMGMEVSALLAISASAWWLALHGRGGDRALLQLGMLAAVGLLVRSDGFLVALPPLALRLWRERPSARRSERRRGRRLALAGGPLVAAFAVSTLARLAYYGDWLPNTYRLKMDGFPLSARLGNGLAFVKPYLAQVLILTVLGALACITHRSRRTLAMAAAPVLLVAYQIFVGGDPWSYWRQLTPGYPLLLLLVAQLLAAAGVALRRRIRAARPLRHVTPIAAVVAMAAGLAPTQAAFADGSVLAFNNTWSRINVARAVFLRKVLRPDARVAVLWAGTTPYYDADHRAIDLLGKCDRVVAAQPPDLSGTFGWDDMRTVPGHNKSKLAYSVALRDADYTELVEWGRDKLPPEEVAKFRSYHVGEGYYLLRMGSPRIDWAAVEALASGPRMQVTFEHMQTRSRPKGDEDAAPDATDDELRKKRPTPKRRAPPRVHRAPRKP